MPECELCNSQNFDVMDGLYFCTQCGTQSQDIREEVNDIETEAIDAKLSVRKTKTRKKKVYDCGKPWFTLEGFQIVIKAQVEYLMRLGIDPALKEVIGQMWFTFVESSTNAFGTQEHKNFAGMTYSRDNMKDFIPTDSINRKTPKRFSGAQLADDALELSSEIAREDFYEDDDPTGGLFEDRDEEQNAESGSHVGSVDKKHKNYKSVEVMTLQHTLAFCFLGLLWLQEPVCLSDLIRWAVEGHLPYFNATAHFPSHMKLSQADVMMFTRYAVPNKFGINTLAGSLSRYISLPDIPRHQINIYIARYAIDLQLPACVHRYLGSVVKIIDMDVEWLNGVFNYDDLAMAYIIISLRLIYGLDDVTEHELAKLATDIDQDENTCFPTWSDLIETIHTGQRMRLENGVPWSEEDLRMLKDCRNYSKFCQEKLFGSWKPECTVHRYKRAFKGVKGLNAEKQAEYANMFAMLLKKGEGDDADDSQNVTSFPFLSARNKASKGRDDISTKNSANPNPTHAKGLSLDAISSYYDCNTEAMESCSLSNSQIHRNRYIRYDFPKCPKIQKQELLRSKWWKDVTLPSSLRQLVEICSKLIYCEPALLFNVVQMLEDVMFEENDD